MGRSLSLSQGQTTTVCDCHYDLVKDRKWSYKEGYAHYSRKLTNEHLALHRIIAGATEGQIVDHINRNKLDNRCSNLRIVSFQENIINRDKQANNTSGYPGVQWRKARQRWIALIGRDRQYIKLGSFTNPEDAYGAYLTARECL